MADNEPAPAPDNGLTITETFYRILYNGNATNMLNTKFGPIDFATIPDLFECAIQMARESPELPIGAIKKVRFNRER